METMSSVSAKDPITKAKELPEGAAFHRCALQVNPHDYGGIFQGQKTSGDARQHAKAIVDKAVEIGVSVLAITNHNDVSGVAAFQEAAKHTNVTIFPGFELSSSEGIHILCIYPPDTGGNRLERFLGKFGIQETSASRCKSLHMTALRLIYLSPTFWRNYMAIREMGNNFRHQALVLGGEKGCP